MASHRENDLQALDAARASSGRGGKHRRRVSKGMALTACALWVLRHRPSPRNPISAATSTRTQVEIRHSAPSRLLPCYLQHPIVLLNADDETIRPNSMRRPQRGLAAPGRQIEHAHARVQSRQVEHSLADGRGQARLDVVVPSPHFLKRVCVAVPHGINWLATLAGATSPSVRRPRGVLAPKVITHRLEILEPRMEPEGTAVEEYAVDADLLVRGHRLDEPRHRRVQQHG
jgi:hypothetical protein